MYDNTCIDMKIEWNEGCFMAAAVIIDDRGVWVRLVGGWDECFG
jgi:hypothetical protein